MQISRHWRMNSQRYRLQGVRYENGAVSLQPRPTPVKAEEPVREERRDAQAAPVELKAAS
ncbi:MAG: hypothetical protein JNJ61_07625 [Anaerolineae bacterium]|nr:hypothetical protein [Anaerolineae bacterium]